MTNSSSIRAMVVEDDSSWQQILTEILTDNGLVVDLASDLKAAHELIKQWPHRIAVVDLSLEPNDHNNTDGLRILDEFRKSDPECRSILLTGFATVDLAVSVLLEYGAFSFLRKEAFNRSQFRDLIQQALASAPKLQSKNNESADVSVTNSDEEGISSSSTDAKVLVVDDDAGWRSILEELLQDIGYDVRLCASFGDALGVLRRDTFALAVIDLSLSNNGVWQQGDATEPKEGFKLLESTKESGIPTIVVSGITSVDNIQQAYDEHSVFAYLEKQTFDRNAFRKLVNEIQLSGKTSTELDRLTEREREVFDLLAKGLTNKEIADRLIISTNTVKRHIKAIFEKLEVHTRAGATSKSVNN